MTNADHSPKKSYNDALVDSLASVAVITIVVITAVYWLMGSPTP